MSDGPDAPFRPNWASPPGDSIRDGLDRLPMGVEDFGQLMGLSPDDVSDLLEGNLRIMPEHAERISEILGGSALFWLRREARYLETLARLANARVDRYAEGVVHTACPTCGRTSWHPMDVFFKWCAACERSYSEVEYRNEERGILGQIHEAHPEWTLEQVVEHLRRPR